MLGALLSRPTRSEAGRDEETATEGARAPFDHADFEQRIGHWRRIAFSAFCSFRDLPVEDAEDLFQELAVSYWAQHDRIKSPEVWFFVCARRKAHRFVLRRRRQQTDPPDTLVTLQAPSRHPDTQTIQQVFFSLSAHCRRLLGCLVMEEWTVDELAAATRRKPRDLISMGSRCIKSLSTRWHKLDAFRSKSKVATR